MRLTRSIAINRRQFTKRAALTLAGAGFVGLAPKCSPVSKEKAVKVAGFVIELSKEAAPLFDLLGAHDLSTLVSTKAIPALEKLKDALSNTDLPTAGSALTTVRNVLSGIQTALLNLPASPRRTTIAGILASANILLLTVEAFVNSEAPAVAADARVNMVTGPSVDDKIMKVLQASKP